MRNFQLKSIIRPAIPAIEVHPSGTQKRSQLASDLRLDKAGKLLPQLIFQGRL
jgi:hypothetical protein